MARSSGLPAPPRALTFHEVPQHVHVPADRPAHPARQAHDAPPPVAHGADAVQRARHARTVVRAKHAHRPLRRNKVFRRDLCWGGWVSVGGALMSSCGFFCTTPGYTMSCSSGLWVWDKQPEIGSQAAESQTLRPLGGAGA